jgi:5-methyltetrahydropteroyltriglutamate--homocysteine methyltransferase
MHRSTGTILTTHTGSLARPAVLRDVYAQASSPSADEFATLVHDSVTQIVRGQADAGVTVLNDGEMSKESYSTYVRQRLTGFDGEGEAVLQTADLDEFPGYAAQYAQRFPAIGAFLQPPACTGDITVADRGLLQADIDNLRAATDGIDATDVFMSAASPGVIAAFFANHHYGTREAYLTAIADAMKDEYRAIAEAGFLLQLDCPDLAMCRHLQWQDLSLQEFRNQARQDVEILNYATEGIDPERMRMHLCWGNYEGPHHKDVALADIIDIVFSARPNAILLEAANPRHEHEWRVFEDVALPEGKVLIPGVIDSTMNYIEHPELIAQRLLRYGQLVGKENIMAGSDCGFGTGAAIAAVDEDIMWAKLRAMADGAELATTHLRHT